MCMELLYENSPSKELVKFDYLAIRNNLLIDDYCDKNEEYGEYCGYGNQIWVKYVSKSGKELMTMLISFADIELENEEEWENWKYITLQGQLTNLSNNDMMGELYDNIYDMIIDSIINSPLYMKDKHRILKILEKESVIWMRTVDFCMHRPDEDTIHPGYDT